MELSYTENWRATWSNHFGEYAVISSSLKNELDQTKSPKPSNPKNPIVRSTVC